MQRYSGSTIQCILYRPTLKCLKIKTQFDFTNYDYLGVVLDGSVYHYINIPFLLKYIMLFIIMQHRIYGNIFMLINVFYLERIL